MQLADWNYVSKEQFDCHKKMKTQCFFGHLHDRYITSKNFGIKDNPEIDECINNKIKLYYAGKL